MDFISLTLVAGSATDFTLTCFLLILKNGTVFQVVELHEAAVGPFVGHCKESGGVGLFRYRQGGCVLFPALDQQPGRLLDWRWR